MYLYDNQLPMEINNITPDPKLYEYMDHECGGCEKGLQLALLYLRQSFMIHNPTFHELFRRIAARRLSDMEVLAELLHHLHGEDDRYYDESNDDTPVFAFIPPCDQPTHKEIKQHHVNNDLSAALLCDIEEEQAYQTYYEQVLTKTKDEETKKVLTYLSESSAYVLQHLRTTLDILTTHDELKDFGEGDMHNAWDLDTSNYFDKPNPYFFNPNDKLNS